MALIKTSGIVAAISGKVGGSVYSRNRYGAYVRNWAKPVNPNSSAQQKVRADMGALVSDWFNELTVAQRASWAVYAAAVNFVNRLGETITLTGFNHYIRSNIARLSNSMTRISAGPTELILPPTDSEFNVALSEVSQEVSVTFDDSAVWCSQDSAYMSIHQGIPQNSARMFFGGHMRRIGKISGSSGSPITSPQTVALSFPVAVSQKDWIQGRIQLADGRLSATFRDDAIVGA